MFFSRHSDKKEEIKDLFPSSLTLCVQPAQHSSFCYSKEREKKKRKRKKNPSARERLQRVPASFNYPSYPDMFNIFASGITVGSGCYCIGEYLLFYLKGAQSVVSLGCMATIAVLENTEINIVTSVLHYCIATAFSSLS